MSRRAPLSARVNPFEQANRILLIRKHEITCASWCSALCLQGGGASKGGGRRAGQGKSNYKFENKKSRVMRNVWKKRLMKGDDEGDYFFYKQYLFDGVALSF